jgi:hypothetical protein
LCLSSGSAALKNIYLPGAVAPTQAWFPLRNADIRTAKAKAESLLTAYLSLNRVRKNEAKNRLEGDTRIEPVLIQPLTASRIGEMGSVFLKGNLLTEVSLAAFHLNWCDFYGALVETEYLPPKKLALDRCFPDALFATGPDYQSVLPCRLKKTRDHNEALRDFFRDMDPPLFDFITRTELDVYVYPVGADRLLIMANFEAGKNFNPGVLMLLKKRPGKKGFEVLAQYFVGEKAEFIQAVLESGSPHPILHTGTFGAGEEYILLQFNGKDFGVVYKKKEGQFP